MKNQLILGDCLEIMKEIPDKSIDLILCDLPYGLTNSNWDKIIDFDDLWYQYKRIIKEKSNIILTASQPFTTDLINSNREWFRYCIVWNKLKVSNFLIAKYQPLRVTEDICIFYKKNGVYNPIMEKAKKENIRLQRNILNPFKSKNKGLFGQTKTYHINDKTLRFPKNIIEINAMERECNSQKRLHKTQKPVSLLEYLIKTYSNEGDIVLDNCIGSGSTAIACINTNRKFIGIEMNEDFYKIAKKRIKNHTLLLNIEVEYK